MKNVLMNKLTVLERLKAAREEHRKIVEEAVDGYLKAVVEELEQNLLIAQSGRVQRYSSDLDMPEDHTAEFDRIIGMIEDTLDEQIELTASEYTTYIRNEWHWKDSFLYSNSAYSATARTLSNNS